MMYQGNTNVGGSKILGVVGWITFFILCILCMVAIVLYIDQPTVHQSPDGTCLWVHVIEKGKGKNISCKEFDLKRGSYNLDYSLK